uniref:Uncharacterized protein n=1 Tax=Schizaphis graminum TaxID=13262 RepID=A0A2S2PUR8_SCHGA
MGGKDDRHPANVESTNNPCTAVKPAEGADKGTGNVTRSPHAGGEVEDGGAAARNKRKFQQLKEKRKRLSASQQPRLAKHPKPATLDLKPQTDFRLDLHHRRW